ncbi:2-C-methyl-D-erythritol 2,4-cyclodiphosphate synthase [Aliidiomarina halalkaliphila]|uniref:2-C-methyl-D-erythritol 2,4-cyclodiphosphate synthase n=1 Tax=Aliidiomarina halalkaliphila TaxID=2593535 RepID=A0A552X3K5_9GAMM|nr:2-C-methyl-D-erythritol 2,4-cyclodiphosphate synthase [Aliidiomarina halalkaliphila]TRW49611.1 2-C-methyl-D-erythritol 2,4-cyclodiphosphate synthase [Aliidiomarina halalkaliphila]
MRVGQGFDVHKFGGEGPIRLAGVTVPHDQGLLAHSDGDVALHALIDALLGAVGLGDIGHWFPDNDPDFAGADSGELLQTAYHAVQKQGFELVNADLTIICERPKIGPYREHMRARVAELLSADIAQVNIKGTTTERLGFTGRGEGIASMAVVLLVSRTDQKGSRHE